jgi:hypothetical protein
MSEHERGLGRIPPSDDRHLRSYSLTAATMPTVPTPVVLGINWYRGFGRSSLVERSGKFYFPHPSKWGSVDGGHAICSKPPGIVDRVEWWQYYDQGNTSRCVDFSICRQQALLNRRRAAAGMIYPIAQRIDEWPGENYDGTSVRAGEEVARTYGMWRIRDGRITGPFIEDGISVYRWALTVEAIAACLSPADEGKRVLDLGFIDLLNSWGVYYPHYVRVDLEYVRRLLREDGEAAIVVDR